MADRAEAGSASSVADGSPADGDETPVGGDETPVVSVVIPARDEAGYLPGTLRRVAALETDRPYEVLVVDGDSEDATAAVAREHGARVVAQERGGIGRGRDLGARAARGEWLAFLDADTRPSASYLDEMVEFARREDLGAASSRCRVVGDPRGRALEVLYNRLFPRKDRPVLPGFNCLVRRDVYEAAGGFPDVASEDRAFSRALAARTAVGFHPDPLVETSARRVADAGLVRTALRYFLLDYRTLRDRSTPGRVAPATLAAGTLAVLAAALQFVHGAALGHGSAPGHLTALPAGTGFLGGIALYALGAYRRALLAAGVGFVCLQVALWVHTGARHGAFGAFNAGVQLAVGGVLCYLLLR